MYVRESICPFLRFWYLCGIFMFIILFQWLSIKSRSEHVYYIYLLLFSFPLGLSVFIFCSKDVISIFTTNQYILFNMVLHSVRGLANVLLDWIIVNYQIMLDLLCTSTRILLDVLRTVNLLKKKPPQYFKKEVCKIASSNDLLISLACYMNSEWSWFSQQARPNTHYIYNWYVLD